ncbi:MAG: lysostaphin resistance A-like protein [Acidimicrobiales bacterium]
MARSPVVPKHTVRWTTVDAVLVLLGAQLLSILWVGFVVVTVYDSTIPDPLPVAALVLLNLGLWLGYGGGTLLVSRAKGRDPIDDYGIHLRRLDLPVGVVGGVVVQAVVLPILYWPLLRFVDGDPSESARELVAGADGLVGHVLLVVAVVVVAPVVEELFFRGLFLRALERSVGTVAAVVVSSAVFALVHRQVLPLPGLFLFGVAAAAITVRTGRLGPAWAFHVGFNLTTLVILALE